MKLYYTKKILNLKQQNLKTKLTNSEINIIVKKFKYLICKIKKNSIIIKHQKFGYEIFHNKLDNKYWSYALTFIEPINPLNPIYKHYWIGNSFIAYGYITLKETIDKTLKMMKEGPTSKIYFNNYLDSWNEEKKLIFLNWKKKEWSFEKYQKFQNWYKKNKIRIMAKQINNKYKKEYYKKINKKNKKTGLTILLEKINTPPKRPKEMYVFMRKTKNIKEEWDNPKIKKYIIGFMYIN